MGNVSTKHSALQIQENDLETLEAGEIANKYHNEIVRTKYAINRNFLYLSRLLFDVANTKLYHTMGYDSMEEYIATPEVNIKRSWFYDLLRVYRQFVLQYEYTDERLLPIGISKLILLTRNKDVNKENVDDWLATAETLSKSDLIRELNKEKEVDEPSHTSSKEDKLRPGFYRITRLTNEPFGDFIEIGSRRVVVGRDESGILLRVR